MKSELPRLDCHAHVSPDVTPDQLARLRPAVVFAVTRSLEEAQTVAGRSDPPLVWGCGMHPSQIAHRNSFETARLERLIGSFALVGEIGLDRRSGDVPEQMQALRAILRSIADQPVLVSLHSAGCAAELVDVISEYPHSGMILHWFLGNIELVSRAVELGCYFSVNSNMSSEAIRSIPMDRMLPETDYPPGSRRGGGKWPGDTGPLERQVAGIAGVSTEMLRRTWYRNLRSVSMESGALDRLPSWLVDLALMA